LEYDPPYVQILSELAAVILRLKETIKEMEDYRTPETMGFLPLAEKKLGFRIGKEGEHWYPVASRLLNLLAKSRERDEEIKHLLGRIAFKSDLLQKGLLEAMLDLNYIKEDIGQEAFPLGRIPTLTPPLPSEEEDEENF